MPPGPAAPLTHKIVVKRAPQRAAHNGDQPGRPLLDNLTTHFGGDALDDPRHETLDSLLRHKKHIWPGPNRKLMSLAHALEVFIRVHPDARVSTVQAARDCALYTACEPGFSPLFQHTNLDAGMPQCLAWSGAAFLSYMILGPLFLGRPVATGLRPRRTF